MSNLEGLDTPETLAGYAKSHVESLCADLEGDNDFTAFITLRNQAGDLIYIAVLMPPPDQVEAKDAIGDYMIAQAMIHRPSEMTFASPTWGLVCGPEGRQADKYPNLADHPDRVEQASIWEVSADGEFTAHAAPLIRENNKVGVGLWGSSTPGIKHGGRFTEAMVMAMAIARDMPPEIRASIDRQLAESNEDSVMASVLWAMRRARALAGQR